MTVVYLHVGLPKTGTTHVQDRLWVNRDLAAKHAGLLYPGNSEEDHFHAATHLNPERYLDWAHPAHADVWPTMLAQMRAWPGKALVTHELFANAGPEQIARLADDLDFADEVHVVLTVRDLRRQLPSVWQENVKNQRPTTFDDFIAEIAATAPGSAAHADTGGGEPFWEFQDYTAVLDNWAAVIPAERIHVVTVPAPGTAQPGDGLWERFLRVLDVDPALLAANAERANASLSAAQAEFLRRLNTRLQPGDIEWQRYERLVKAYLIGRGLVETGGGKPLGLNAEQSVWAAETSETMIARIVDGGYRVVGSLDDLRVAPVAGAEVEPPTPEATLEAGLDALAYWILQMPMPAEPTPAVKTRAANVVRRARRRAVGLRAKFAH